MNTNLLRTLIVAAVASSATAAEIPAGTHLLLNMENSISTSTAKVGDRVDLRTVIPISVDGKIIIPVGSYAQGVVTQAKRSGRVHGKAELQIQLVTLLLPSGEVLRLSPRSASLAPEGHAPRRYVASPLYGILAGGGVVAGALIGANLGGSEEALGKGALIGLGAGIAIPIIVAVLHRGSEVELRQGSPVDVVFDQSANID
jgi:type IV secretion system protein VirB10